MKRPVPAGAKRSFEFTSEEILERVRDHWDLADDFVGAILKSKPRVGATVEINKRLLGLATKSAYLDIARYKNFHQDDPWGEYLDCVKRGAYLAKWIVRFKPLVVLDDEGGAVPARAASDLTELEVINEFFALRLFEVHLSAEIGFDVELSDHKRKDLAYDLLYRHLSAEALIAIFQLLKDCCVPTMRDVGFITKIKPKRKRAA